jgi:RNA polymerase sigma-B factor
MPLVRSIARRHVGKGEELEDLVQVGYVGLLKASDRFDPGREVAFATFAAPVIEGEIRHHLRDRSAPVRIPRALEEARTKLLRRRSELESTLGRPPTTGELAKALDVHESEIEGALIAERARRSVSITSELGHASHAVDGEALTSSDDRLLLASSMRSLDERERQIVFLRFHADMTERQIAGEVGLSQAHVSRLLTGALAKLRTELTPNADAAPEDDVVSGVEMIDPGGAAGTRISPVARAGSGTTGKLTVAEYLARPYHLDVASTSDGGRSRWIASVEELPGCTAQGDTAEEAVSQLRPAMESWLTAAIAEHREIPMPAEQDEISVRAEQGETATPAEQDDIPAPAKKGAQPRSADSYSGRFLVRMPKSLHADLASAAERQQVSLNRLVTEILAGAVEGRDLGSSPSPSAKPGEASTRSAESGQSSAPSAEPAQASRLERSSPRSIRLVLATNLAVVILAAIVALVLLVLALQRGV